MKLLIPVLLVSGFGQTIQAVPVPGHQTLRTRHNRDVPMTSYFRDSVVQGQPASGAIPTIVKQTEESSVNGDFSYSFETDNGISVEVKGYQKPIGDKTGQVMEGRYSYTAPDGTPVNVQWTADETGFHANVVKQTASKISAK